MKLVIVSSLITCLVAGCGSKANDLDPQATIAGDRTKLLETLKRADTSGTVTDAFALAANDSSLREKMMEALGRKSRHADARDVKGGPKKDILDKSSDALDVANEKVTKSGEVLDKASDVKKKTEAILSK